MTITRRYKTNNCIVFNSTGKVSYSTTRLPQSNIRPVFYLNSNVVYVSGDGNMSSPYRIA